MHEILILYILLVSQNTMYGIAKAINKSFGFLSNPSFGTLQPALKRLEKQGFVKADKFFTDGGKPYFYYSITDEGKVFLNGKIRALPSKNPVQFIPEVKLKLVCSDILNPIEKKDLYKALKTELNKLRTQTEDILKSESYSDNPTGRLVLDNSVCECKNLVDLIEGLEKCPQ